MILAQDQTQLSNKSKHEIDFIFEYFLTYAFHKVFSIAYAIFYYWCVVAHLYILKRKRFSIKQQTVEKHKLACFSNVTMLAKCILFITEMSSFKLEQTAKRCE